ncbi:MAG: adenosine deaminase [Verrucomicrobiae bacterium]|nr:adenosine deaminase [Verrucomicrobiae bacterium]
MSKDLKLIQFIDALPKAEHHLHLEGSTPWHIMQQDDPDEFQTPPDSWVDDFRFKDFAEFESYIINYVVPWLQSPERYAITAREILLKRMQENVRYAEISYAALAIERSGVDITEVAVAVKSAIPAGIDVKLFIGLHHRGFTQDQDKYLSEILDCPHIDGIDLHGPEQFPLQDWIKEFWSDARMKGKLTKAHAGELTGPLGVREVIEFLGVTKIQHGVQVIQDESAINLAASEGASFDVCPISNVKLKAVPSLEEHPILHLEQSGIKCTINTDDPFIFGNELRDDYLAVSQGLGASPRQLAQFARNGFETAPLEEEKKRSAYAEIDALLSAFEEDN